MRNAYERREEYNPEGKCLKREWAIGPIAVWGIVTLVALFKGHALINLPSSLWDFFKW